MTSPVTARLQAAEGKPAIMAVWEEFVKQEIQAADEDEDEDDWW